MTGSNEDFFDRIPPSLVKKEEIKEKDNRNNAAKGLESYSNFNLYGMPINFVESAVVYIGLIGIAYLFYASGVFFVEGARLRIIFGIIMFFIMFCITLTKKSIADIIIRDINNFKKQFSYKDTGKMITTSDQISFLMNLAISALKSWKISWLAYTAFIMVLYLIAFYLGLFMTVIILLILLAVIVLKGPEVSNNLEKYFRSKTKNISPDPPNIGIMTFFGNPLDFDLILASGTVIIYPGVIDFLTVEVHQEPYDLKKMTGFISKDNIQVILTNIQVLYIPDIMDIKTFIEAKKQKGVEDILDNRIQGKLRELIRAKDFEVLLGEKAKIEESIIKFLLPEEEHKNISKMSKKGIKDCHSLGTIIYNFNIGSIETTEEYAEEMMKKGTEKKQQQAEKIETETEVAQATIFQEAFKKAGTPKSFESCLQLVKDDKIAREGHKITPGLRAALSFLNPGTVAEVLKLYKELKKGD